MKIRFDIQDEAAFKVIKEINDLDFDSIYSSIVSSVLENLFKDFDKPSHVQSINVIFKVMDGIAYTTPLLDSSKTIYFSTTYLKDIYIKDGFDRFYNELCGVLLHETV